MNDELLSCDCGHVFDTDDLIGGSEISGDDYIYLQCPDCGEVVTLIIEGEK